MLGGAEQIGHSADEQAEHPALKPSFSNGVGQ